MLGIPTRSDVKDKRYKKSLEAELFKKKIDFFCWPTSSCFLHNHVNSALRHAKEDVFQAEDIYKKGEKASDSVTNNLNPAIVLDYYLNGINNFRTALEEVNSSEYGKYINRENWIKTTHDANKNFYYDGRLERNCERAKKRKLVDIVKSSECRMDVCGKKEKGIMYIYNPYQVAMLELSDMEKELKEAFNSSQDPPERIYNIWLVIDKFDDSANKSLIEGISSFYFYDWPFSIEHKKGTEANKLRNVNEEIGKKSDMYIRFNEFYLIAKYNDIGHEALLPLYSITDERERKTQHGLGLRQHMRDFIERKVENKGSIVFNSVEYKAEYKELIPMHEKPRSMQAVSHFVAEKEPVQEFVNLLGHEVLYTKGDKILSHYRPEEWAAKEIGLVSIFRNGDRKVADEFFKIYRGFDDDHISTNDEKVELLSYTLKRDEELIPAVK